MASDETQPIMWVPTEAEVWAEGRTLGPVDFRAGMPPRPSADLADPRWSTFDPGPNHIHYAVGPRTDREETP